MKRLLLAALISLCAAVPALAQYTGTPMYCNGGNNGSITSAGNTQIVTAPIFGSIFVCGYNLSTNGASVTVTIGYGTGTAAVFNSLSQGWPISATAPFVTDISSVFRGLYVPPGNVILMNLSNNAGVGFEIYFTYQQNR